MTHDRSYFSNLYEIAKNLNREFSLPSALRNALENTVKLLDLETGWIWLVEQDLRSVYLAASFNLPPALSKRPERLSGWCYCIEKYLSQENMEGSNISEIKCTRLKDIQTGTRDLKYHATIPISMAGEKIGILNLLSKESRQLTESELALVNTISELIAIAVQRTRSHNFGHLHGQSTMKDMGDVLNRAFGSRLYDLRDDLMKTKDLAKKENQDHIENRLDQSITDIDNITDRLSTIVKDSLSDANVQIKPLKFNYPTSPLTSRELEVLGLVKKGLTNKQAAEQLYISERTIKFHVSSILSKLYAKTRSEAVDIAVKRGLIGL